MSQYLLVRPVYEKNYTVFTTAVGSGDDLCSDGDGNIELFPFVVCRIGSGSCYGPVSYTHLLGGSAEWTKILDRLNGKIYLIMGNHDLKNIRQGYIDRFEHVAMQMHIEIGKQRIYLNHYPFLCFDGGYKDFLLYTSNEFGSI